MKSYHAIYGRSHFDWILEIVNLLYLVPIKPRETYG